MIEAKYKHTKFGNLMFKLCAGWTMFIVKHRILYYILSCTWGLLLTLIGLIVTLSLSIIKLFIKSIKFEKFAWVYFIGIGVQWGGFETGLMFVRDLDSSKGLSQHEFGHTFQNTLFGPIQIIWSISSMIRYWYITIRCLRGHTVGEYDSYWLEDAASQCGEYADNFISNKDN